MNNLLFIETFKLLIHIKNMFWFFFKNDICANHSLFIHNELIKIIKENELFVNNLNV